MKKIIFLFTAIIVLVASFSSVSGQALTIYGPSTMKVGVQSTYYFLPKGLAGNKIWGEAGTCTSWDWSHASNDNYYYVNPNEAGTMAIDACTGWPMAIGFADKKYVTVYPSDPWIKASGTNVYLAGDPLSVYTMLTVDNTHASEYDDFEYELTGTSSYTITWETVGNIGIYFYSHGQNSIRMKWKQNGVWSSWSNSRPIWVTDPSV